jgi:hypothetical protein
MWAISHGESGHLATDAGRAGKGSQQHVWTTGVNSDRSHVYLPSQERFPND